MTDRCEPPIEQVDGLMTDYAAKAGFTVGLMHILLQCIKSLPGSPLQSEIEGLKVMGERIETELKRVLN